MKQITIDYDDDGVIGIHTPNSKDDDETIKVLDAALRDAKWCKEFEGRRCDKCGRVIPKDEPWFTAVGIIHCKECDVSSNGAVSMDEVWDKIIRSEGKK
jgi:hypothetical protein